MTRVRIPGRRLSCVTASFIIGFSCLSLSAIAFAEEAERNFSYGITGSAHPVETENPSHYFRRSEVQALVVDMAPRPMAVAEVEKRMADVDGVTADDLFRTGLLRKEGDNAFINFAFNTEEDILIIRSVIDEPLSALTQSYFEHSDEISEILDSYPAKTVSKGALAFIILGAFSLDWDGLYLTAELGYRARPSNERGHFFRADEQSDAINMREVYKGSHNLPAGWFHFSIPFDSTFTTFGDHYRRGRAAFPDIFWQPVDWYNKGEEEVVEALLPFSVEQAVDGGFVSEQTAAAIAELLYALRKSPENFKALRKILNVDSKRLTDILNLLIEIQYIDQMPNGHYVLLIPVLDYDDSQMVDALIALSGDIIETWLEQYYDKIQAGLGDTTAMRHGLSYEEYFSNIWHHIFGLQNKEMARAGMFAHPYGIDKKYKAFFPALWRSELYDLCSKEVFPCERP